MTRLAGLPGLILALVLALLWTPALAAPAAPTFPELSGRVVDSAHVLDAQTQADLTRKLADLEARTSRQLVVVTLPTLGGYEIEDYGVQLLRHWGIGQKGINNGVLFIVVPSEHKVRIEVGYGMEGILTDALSSVILQEAVIPRFKAGDVQGGVVAGTDQIIAQMTADPSTAEAKAAAAAQQTVHHRHGNPIGGLIPLIVIFFIFTSIFRRRGYGGGGGLGWVLPLMFLGGGRGGGWGGGGGGDWGGGGGGGGFGGGGGSGGGGGASGSW